ncbi:MAG TPA: TerB family tellurite resistance protein, partial [Candidatus Sulfomarinibacteraceae bacterium]|nr:TerB family tellurite resistance protein [Candidatus Sulfomarinibacteraceae bacterium]
AEGDRERLLHCLFAVTAADDSISLVEEEEIRQVANELGVEHAQFTEIRAAFRDKREVLRGLRGTSP